MEYSEAVFTRWLSHRGVGAIPHPDGRAGFTGPCGGSMEISLRIRDDVILEARFLTDGSPATVACASVVVELATGMTLDEAAAISPERVRQRLGELPQGSRHCAFLAVTTLRAAIADHARCLLEEP
jgi:nitrogen fixation NifU-like protein